MLSFLVKYWNILRFFLFLLSAELAHRLVLFLLTRWHSYLTFRRKGSDSKTSQNISPSKGRAFMLGGKKLSHPLGLAAGLDKDAEAMGVFSHLGFAFMEVGTVTPLAQQGNPKPRLFRLPHSKGIINRLGFNSAGSLFVRDRLQHWKSQGRKDFPVGVNIGKNFLTPIEEAVLDYEKVLRMLYPFADFFVLNLSSPNTPGLRMLQEEAYLKYFLAKIRTVWKECENSSPGISKELLLKISPDMEKKNRKKLVELAMEAGLSGLVAVNTTLSREGIYLDPRDKNQKEVGGLSGKPLKELSLSHIKELRDWMGEKALLISVGGIESVEEGERRLSLGADLVEIYTGFIYEGPSLSLDFKRHFSRFS